MRKKLYRILFCVVMTIAVSFTGIYNPMEGKNLLDRTVTINLWYTDEALTDYLNSAALYYHEESGVRVVPQLVSGLEYLENVNAESIAGEDIPDLFVVSNDALGKAYLAGLALPVAETADFEGDKYPQAAVDAVTYQDKKVAYPLYYETSVLLCNETYLEQMAQSAIQAEADAAEGEEAMNAVEQAASDEELERLAALAAEQTAEDEKLAQEDIESRKASMVPATMEEMLNFADEYDAPENVESILKWDVSDIFYNYFFVGSAISVGGDAGDDKGKIDIYNDNAITALTLYQQLNQFFSIDAEEVTYDSVLEEFMAGKTVFTIATTDAIGKIDAAKEAGNFNYEYAVAALPAINDSLPTRSMSVTYGLAVNGYGTHTKEANDFATYLAGGEDELFYQRTGKIPARGDIVYSNANVAATMTEYAQSVPVPKMLETGNFWVNLEIAFTNIWNGQDVDTVLKELSDQTMLQVEATQ